MKRLLMLVVEVDDSFGAELIYRDERSVAEKIVEPHNKPEGKHWRSPEEVFIRQAQWIEAGAQAFVVRPPKMPDIEKLKFDFGTKQFGPLINSIDQLIATAIHRPVPMPQISSFNECD